MFLPLCLIVPDDQVAVIVPDQVVLGLNREVDLSVNEVFIKWRRRAELILRSKGTEREIENLGLADVSGPVFHSNLRAGVDRT